MVEHNGKQCGKVTIYRPCRKNPRVYTPRAVGRIIAYARNDGADDAVLIAHILNAFGLRKLQCLTFKVLDILNNAIFLGALLTLLNGLLSIIKGAKLIATGTRSTLPGFLELLIPKKYLASLGGFLLVTGALSSLISGLIIFITAISNNVALYLLAKGVCDTEVPDLNVEVDTLNLGDLPENWEEISDVLSNIKL